MYGSVALTLTIISVLGCGQAPVSEGDRPTVVDEVKIEGDFTDVDYDAHVKELEKKVPEGFTIILQKPFVVIGDEAPDMVRRRAEKTIKWAVDMLKQDYFEKDPDEIIDIWLFKDDESYDKHTNAIFDDEPTTPFGYYSEEHKSLIMNISTGGGTLVHEIVHPFIRANFPECPVWFNEGLASLYEQCGEKDGHIYGFTNWRLKDLQEAISGDLLPSFMTLTAMNDIEFYEKDRGTNYGQVRYLCYYLQEKGLLVVFYHEFSKNSKRDPTGYNTLKKIIDEENMEVFKNEWEKFVLRLTFP